MHEYELRNELKRSVLARQARDPETRIVDELGLRHGLARIDIAVINGIMHGYELKSDKDNLKRLPHQVQVYNSVLDKITLVVGSRHANEAATLVPNWWGIKIARLTTRGGIEFENHRRAHRNPSVDPLSVCKLLWRDEALTLLDELGGSDGVRHKPRAIVYSRLSQVAGLESLQERVRRQLKSRTNWRAVEPQMRCDD